FTGAAERNRMMGMTPLSIVESLRHPLFSPAGAAGFWAELTRTFWRGEIVWLGQRMATRAGDILFVASTAVFLLAFVARCARREPFLVVICLGIYLLHVGLLAAFSVSFDFGQGVYPSREWPFFSSGRLIFGAAVPLLLMFVLGMDWLLATLRLQGLRWTLLIAFALAITLSEALLAVDAFQSQFNWFHLGAEQGIDATLPTGTTVSPAA
ncbi:MAG: hypothetical protein NZ561_02550, partial [Phycisphaerae bacterium]|nr:hypothetical protein [Phycisphaerae bacterium]